MAGWLTHHLASRDKLVPIPVHWCSVPTRQCAAV